MSTEPITTEHNGFGITSLVLGLSAGSLDLIAANMTIFDSPGVYITMAVIASIVGIVFGALAVRRVGRRQATNRNMSHWGLALSILALMAAVGVGSHIASEAERFGDQVDEFTNELER